MEVGVVGKPNVGKSTLFNALTLMDVPMAPYPFTTIHPNRGVSAVRTPCPHLGKGTPCTPGNARCIDGVRWVPVNLVDVPGLVPGAHEGKGLGHKFLDDLRAADGYLQVVDGSGATTAEGELAPAGSVDPSIEVEWLEEELVRWVAGILGRDFMKHARTAELEESEAEDFLHVRLTGLAIGVPAIATALRAAPIDRDKPSTWTEADRFQLARALLHAARPRLVAANKCDRSDAERLGQLASDVAPIPVVPTCAEAELTLRRAGRAGLVQYHPGDPGFSLSEPSRLNDAQRKALHEIEMIMKRFGSTGVQQALEQLVFGQLHQIVVFPVEDETHWTDSKGRVLPDAFLLPASSPVRQMAYKVHTELGENFIRAIDGRTHRALAADHPLENGAVVRIVARR
ncbi:MAG: YchF-related putative GTPase [Thermoplasmata archaeon]|nr:YchF-related putative GTPase [Thermoplasmata archaeon]